jgi:MFS transporter, PAT family, beta-lactamase induction signal transducer AmpG
MNQTKAPDRTGWYYVPTLYFAEGLPYILINAVSVILYKKMGVDNTAIAFYTSWLYLPWVIKMFWGPLVDMLSTKRRWILSTQLVMALCLLAVALSLRSENHYFFISLAGFVIGAFISATHDIAADGFYMLSLNREQQAFFVGIRTLFYRLAMIFGNGLLVYVAGQIEIARGDVRSSWILAFGGVAILYGAIWAYHVVVLPRPAGDAVRGPRKAEAGQKASFADAIVSYFRQDGITAILLFIVLYRFGEAMLVKLASPFLLDKVEAGGMGLSTAQVGIVYGTVGLTSLIVGGVLGGWTISRLGFRRCIWPMALALNLPDLFYVYMAYAHPPLVMVYPLVAVEQFGYGFGFTAFTVFVMYVSKGIYKTSHFAISTGIMALGMMLPGFVSGKIQSVLGYPMFFVLVCLFTIPGMLTIPFLPVKDDIDGKTSD